MGDYVIAEWPEDDSHAVIRDLFPRKSCFIRKAAGSGKQEQVVAANIDTVLICMALNRNFNISRLERYLAVTYESGATPVVILTKADLCDDAESKVAEAQRVAPDVDVFAVSSLRGDYERVLKYIAPGKTVAFLGSSIPERLPAYTDIDRGGWHLYRRCGGAACQGDPPHSGGRVKAKRAAVPGRKTV